MHRRLIGESTRFGGDRPLTKEHPNGQNTCIRAHTRAHLCQRTRRGMQINYAWEEAPMRMVLAFAALVSIAFGLIAVGRAWYEFRPLTDKERARLRQEGN